MDLERKKTGIEAIRDFKAYFLKEFGLELIVIISSPKNKHFKVDLVVLEEITNKILHDMFPGKYPEGIKKKIRKREIVSLRFCFFKVALEMGYSLTSIGLYLGFDHATVLHGNRTATNLMDTMNSQIILNYNLILNGLKERSRDDADVQSDKHSEPNT